MLYVGILVGLVYWSICGYFVQKSLKKGMFFSTWEYQVIGVLVSPIIAPLAAMLGLMEKIDDLFTPKGKIKIKDKDYYDNHMHIVMIMLGGIAFMTMEVAMMNASKADAARTPAAAECVCKK